MTPLERLVGIPWRIGGRDETGTDCVGLALMAQRELWAREIVLSPSEVRFNENDWPRESARIASVIRAHLRPAPGPGVGRVVLLRVGGCHHLATFVDPTRLLHIFEGHASRLSAFSRRYQDRAGGYFETEEVI